MKGVILPGAPGCVYASLPAMADRPSIKPKKSGPEVCQEFPKIVS